MKISICVPVYDQMKNGETFLKRLLESVEKQTFKDYEIVMTHEKGMANNINASIKKAKGELIKILFHDDFLNDENSLQDIVDNFTEEDRWMISACQHFDGQYYYNSHFPTYTHDIYTGNNRIGSPSVLTISNKRPLFFDKKMRYFLDCDYYKRLYVRYGEPKILNSINVVIGTGDHQTTNTMSNAEKPLEAKYMETKYA